MKISPKLVLTTVLLLIQVIVLWAVFPSFGNDTLLLFIIFTLVGFVVATLYRNWPSLWRRIRYRDSASWPIVPGTIEKSDVHEEPTAVVTYTRLTWTTPTNPTEPNITVNLAETIVTTKVMPSCWPTSILPGRLR